MHLFFCVPLIALYFCACLGGTLEVIDYDGQCVMWSVHNHGCTGYSAPFGLIDGSDCSHLSEVEDGTREKKTVLNVDACGTEDGEPVAWITVNETGLVTFSNKNGAKTACTLNDGLKVGSSCDATNSASSSVSHLCPTSSITSSGPSSIPNSAGPTPSQETISSSDSVKGSGSSSTLGSSSSTLFSETPPPSPSGSLGCGGPVLH
ncbi:hypothetical protein N7508_007175 [Penicillium antarcticum]|uniref:uncharacterized protein n=1 Tax=Penicillium antarcticum TaxID=416450 RepID=UPI0023A781A1|nr:uncharacterized protein N7508_007175 [Penicillium antarcticum]KAJ5302312.1 hypothetical protein N7508_007175 [Penicillium antarcticum]